MARSEVSGPGGTLAGVPFVARAARMLSLLRQRNFRKSAPFVPEGIMAGGEAVADERGKAARDRIFPTTTAARRTLAEASLRAAAAVAPGSQSAAVAYFGPDLDDPAVRRRVAQWRYAGFEVLALAFSRRGREVGRGEGLLSLGRLAPQSRAGRILPLMLAGCRLLRRRKHLANADLFIARNLDNACLGLFARWVAGNDAPFVYEVLDINPSCTGPGWQAALLRQLEKWLLARVDLLVVSSPHFISAYYQDVLHFRNSWLLFENKIPRYVELPRSSLRAPGAGADEQPREAGQPRRWRIGWFGYLDDQRAWSILRGVAAALPDRVSVHVRGLPYTNFDTEAFLAEVRALPNVTYDGPFRNPDDLADMYESVDIVWSADCNAPSANSKWLLTNGIYEAGYFGKPVIGLARTAVGEFLTEYRSGWCLSEPIEEQLIALMENLTVEQYEEKCKAIAELRADRFVETDEVDVIWDLVRSLHRRRPSAATPPRKLETLS
jgi:succinoglycan biosynthesis protein ExoL